MSSANMIGGDGARDNTSASSPLVPPACIVTSTWESLVHISLVLRIFFFFFKSCYNENCHPAFVTVDSALLVTHNSKMRVLSLAITLLRTVMCSSGDPLSTREGRGECEPASEMVWPKQVCRRQVALRAGQCYLPVQKFCSCVPRGKRSR